MSSENREAPGLCYSISMRALVLAAGWATRLGALAANRPKHLLPVGETTPLDVVVDRLDAVARVETIDVVTHEAFLAVFERWAAGRTTRARLRVWSNGATRFEERRGAVGDLHYYLERTGTRTDLLVLGGDQLFDDSLEALAETSSCEPALAVHDVGTPERVSRLASVELDAAGYVRRLVEKDPNPSTTLAAPAIYGLPARLLGEVAHYLKAEERSDNLGHLAEWLVERHPVRGVRLGGRWIDVGSPDDYDRARGEFGGGEPDPVP
jgi:glucose-1-phosphate thymidylyltransferase